MSNRSENSHIEIGVWDPSSVAKPSSQSPVNHPSQSYGVPASSQHSWHSQPSNNSVGSDFNLSSMRDSMPYQHQQAPVEGNVSNIFYTPSQQGGYIQTSDPTPYSSISGNSMSMMPQSNPPQRAWSTAQPSESAADRSQNWRNPPPQPYNNMQQQYVPYGTPHLNPQQPRQNSTTQNFVNPLISNVDSEAADIKVDRMHKAAQEAEEIKNTMMKKPTTISKGALAVLQKDLKDAAAPFQSPEALKQFRDRQLGILNPETNNYTESSTNINPEQILSSSNLSATAAEFVPQFAEKSDISGLQMDVSAEGGGEVVVVPKLNLPLSPDSDRAQMYDREQQGYKMLSTEESGQDNGQGWYAPYWLDVIGEDIVDPFETNIFQNPMDGPNLHPSPLKKPKHLMTMSTPVKMMSAARRCHIDKESNIDPKVDKLLSNQCQSSFSTSNDSHTKNEQSDLLVLSSFPFVKNYEQNAYTSTKQLPILGLCPLDHLGFQSEQECLTELQSKVKKAQVPPLTTIDEHDAVEHINQCINNLIVYPACFDSTVPSMLKTLKSYALPESTVQKAVDIIYETCIIEPNFRYLGAQLCDTLARSDTGIPKFRSILLSKAQKEFQNMDNALGSDDITIERARGFTHFVSELFLSLMMERPSGKLERFAILGRAILGVMEKLIKHANDENIQCVVRVLKLTVMSMEDSLKDDEKGSAEKMQSILDNLISFLDDDKQSVKLSKATTNLLSGFKKLRADNWGRVSKEETQAASNTKQFYPGQQESPTNESFMINEPVFFTPDGVQYTAADAADPEFYNKFLARFDDQAYNMAGPSVPDAAQYTTNPLDEPPWAGDYNDWSPADADQFDLAAAEDDIKYDDDDYDVELEMFINKIVG